jgi:hypothetical protein
VYGSFSVSSVASHSMRAHSTTGAAEGSRKWVIRITVTSKGLMRQRHQAQQYRTPRIPSVAGVANSNVLNELDGWILRKYSAIYP